MEPPYIANCPASRQINRFASHLSILTIFKIHQCEVNDDDCYGRCT